MIVALLLLSQDDCYVKTGIERDILPSRPDFDKSLLASVLNGQNVTSEGMKMLPPSIKKLVRVGSHPFPVTIREIANADMLIVSRSEYPLAGKKFRLDNFTMVAKQPQLEIWMRKI